MPMTIYLIGLDYTSEWNRFIPIKILFRDKVQGA